MLWCYTNVHTGPHSCAPPTAPAHTVLKMLQACWPSSHVFLIISPAPLQSRLLWPPAVGCLLSTQAFSLRLLASCQSSQTHIGRWCRSVSSV